MAWLLFAFFSAVLLGVYDVCKKKSLRQNAVLPVLLLNTVISSLIFLPAVLMSAGGSIAEGSLFYVPATTWEVQKYIFLKSCIVLSSWVCGYFGMAHLPITLVGPINATRPVIVLVGALLFFGEHLNAWQWAGVVLAIVSFFMLSRSGKREGIDFRHNCWIVFTVLAAALGAVSGLYDKYLMASPENGGVGLDRMAVQSYYNFYQAAMMGAFVLYQSSKSKVQSPKFHWDWAIPLISIFLSVADFMYFYSLSLDGALVSVVSMVRRSSVLVSFAVGAMIFHEKNLRSKAIDLALVLLGMICLYIGAR